MAELWLPPDGELLVINELKKHKALLGCRVSASKPDAVEHVQVIATGGNKANVVADDQQVTLTCWAKTWPRAHRLAQIVRGLIETARERGDIAGRECYASFWLNTAYKDPDPVTNSPRVSQTLRLRIRGAYETV